MFKVLLYVCMANSVDPDQMPHSVASDLGLHCLQRPICHNRVIMAEQSGYR